MVFLNYEFESFLAYLIHRSKIDEGLLKRRPLLFQHVGHRQPKFPLLMKLINSVSFKLEKQHLKTTDERRIKA